MVSEHGDDPERGPEALELPDDGTGRPRVADDVAGERHQIRIALDAEVDRLAKRAHVERRRPRVKVAHVQDGEPVEGGRQAGNGDVDLPALDPLRLEEAPGGGARPGRGQDAESP